jgi:chemotaxis protein histidine kinase CheA
MSAPAPGAAIDQVALLEVFLIEANECLREMRQALREMQAPADRGRELERVYRCVRVIAGNAPSLGLDGPALLAHAVQGVLLDVRARSLPLSDTLLATLSGSVTRLRDMLPPIPH